MAYIRVYSGLMEDPETKGVLAEFFPLLEFVETDRTWVSRYRVSNFFLSLMRDKESEIEILICRETDLNVRLMWQKGAWFEMNYFVYDVIRNEDKPGLGFWVDMRNEHGHWVLFSIPKEHNRAVELIMWLDDNTGMDIVLPDFNDLKIEHFLRCMDEKKQAQLAWINS